VKKDRGFTLIELLVVMAIIAILAAIAIPSYLNQTRKSRRSEVEGAIQQIALFEERFRADCTTYANAFSYACPTLSTLTFPADPYTPTYYTVAFVSADASSYKIQAVANGTQANDVASGTSCATLFYDFGVTTSGTVTTTPAACWAK
jgi:type IV pilus assembly protein PilE